MATTTGSAAPSIVVRVDSSLTENVSSHLTVAASWEWKMAVLLQYSQYNDAIGRPIQLLPQYSFCPALIQRDQRPVFLYNFVEVLDELVDYQDIKDKLPGLSFRQIGGAIAFLRKLAQFNLKGIDIDALIDSEEAADQELQDNLRSVLTAQEASVVLSIP
ncbi:MAG: hypothetical protein ABSC19_16140 [Syntrophorhabdales bacterium]|jgi:hypothetical protein